MIRVRVDLPWPWAPREVVLDAVAVDALPREILVTVNSLGEGGDGTDPARPCVPPAEEGVIRTGFNGGFRFERAEATPELGPTVRVSCLMNLDPKVRSVPMWLLTFVVRTVLPLLWAYLLRTARSVGNGRANAHAQRMEERKEVYDWIRGRVTHLCADAR
mmetsp:Transcript_5993/g.20256  ORF Transcript_5993/g.20256 Transcript_5993/m.20256 type:complete len:160 (+) Transcript_5993:546-1025(+)